MIEKGLDFGLWVKLWEAEPDTQTRYNDVGGFEILGHKNVSRILDEFLIQGCCSHYITSIDFTSFKDKIINMSIHIKDSTVTETLREWFLGFTDGEELL